MIWYCCFAKLSPETQSLGCITSALTSIKSWSVTDKFIGVIPCKTSFKKTLDRTSLNISTWTVFFRSEPLFYILCDRYLLYRLLNITRFYHPQFMFNQRLQLHNKRRKSRIFLIYQIVAPAAVDKKSTTTFLGNKTIGSNICLSPDDTRTDSSSVR